MPGDKIFLDSNVLIYIYSLDEPDKRAIAISLCEHYAVISFQVMNEISNVLTGKFNLDPNDVAAKLDELSNSLELKNVDILTIKKALSLKSFYKYSYFDCLMLASALISDCSIIYSEDLQHGQIIENKLKIVNPFIEKHKHTKLS